MVFWSNTSKLIGSQKLVSINQFMCTVVLSNEFKEILDRSQHMGSERK